MFKKILWLLLQVLGLLVAVVAIWGYLDSIPLKKTEQFCDAIPLAIPIEAANFKQALLRIQPGVVFGHDNLNDLRFEINARSDAITEQEIAASGMEAFFSKAGGQVTDEKPTIIFAMFQGSLPFSGYECEIRLEQQRVSSKRILDIDNHLCLRVEIARGAKQVECKWGVEAE